MFSFGNDITRIHRYYTVIFYSKKMFVFFFLYRRPSQFQRLEPGKQASILKPFTKVLESLHS